MTARKSTLSLFGWAFGISLSVLFVSLWGRAVVIDTDTLGDSLAPMAGSDLVVGLFTDWMADEMVDAGADPGLVDPAVDRFLTSSEVGETLDQLAAEVVIAAASPDPGGSTVDVRGLMASSVSEVTAGLNSMGIPVTEPQVSQAVGELDPLVIRDPGSPAIVGPNSPAATHLGTASLLAMLGLVVFGTAYLAVSDDRVAALRSLVTRIAVGGLSFGILLRVGSWVLDPAGGRAPLRATVSSLAASKWVVPFQLGLAAAIMAALIYVTSRLLRRGVASRSSSGSAIGRAAQPRSRSGRR